MYHGPFRRPSLQAFKTIVDTIADGPVLALPVLWVHGEEDPLAPLDATEAAVPRTAGADVTRRVYPGARHEVIHETNRDEVIGEVVAFLDRVAPAS